MSDQRSARHSSRLTGAIAAALVAGACASHRSTPAAAVDSAADVAAITRTGAEFSQRYMRGDAKGMSEIYTEDGAIFPPGRPIIRGRAAIAEYWKLPAGVAVIEHKTTADSIVLRGDIAYDYGTFRARNSRDGQPGAPGAGKYVIVWRRQSDGRWLMHLDIWNASPAPAP